MSLSERAPRIAHKLKPALEERDIARLWRAIEDARHGQPTRERSTRMALAGVALGALFCLSLVLASGAWREVPRPLSLEGTHTLPSKLEATRAKATFRLDDGSHLVLERGARAEVLRNGGGELVAVLRMGKSTFDVRPGGKRRWTIEAGAVAVHVLGTRFAVERSRERVRVSVERGVVLVRGASVPDGVRRLTAGQAFEVSVPPEASALEAHALPVLQAPAQAEVAPASLSEEPVQATGVGVSDIVAAPKVHANEAARAREPSWSALLRRGERQDALAELARKGGVAAMLEHTHEPRLLLELADLAREAQDPHAAVLVLEQLLAREPRASEAVIAAFTLGRLELETLLRPCSAAGRFSLVLERGLLQPLAEDALARLAEALFECGDVSRARVHALTYLERFPDGRRRAQVVALLGRLP